MNPLPHEWKVSTIEIPTHPDVIHLVTYHEVVFAGEHLPGKTRLQGIQLQITAPEIPHPLHMYKMDT